MTCYNQFKFNSDSIRVFPVRVVRGETFWSVSHAFSSARRLLTCVDRLDGFWLTLLFLMLIWLIIVDYRFVPWNLDVWMSDVWKLVTWNKILDYRIDNLWLFLIIPILWLKVSLLIVFDLRLFFLEFNGIADVRTKE